MTPRLTRRGRRFVAKGFIGTRCAGRQSPRERTARHFIGRVHSSARITP